jgi:DNA-directed RNA polymerase subunit alpha
MEITVGQGRGYVAVGEKETKNLDLGTIAIDSLYTPIRDVGYNVEMTRVGDVTDYEKLTLTIETNGTITPKEAVVQATRILMDNFNLIADATSGAGVSQFKEEVTEVSEEKEEPVVEEVTEEEGTAEKKKTNKKKASKKK